MSIQKHHHEINQGKIFDYELRIFKIFVIFYLLTQMNKHDPIPFQIVVINKQFEEYES